MRETYIEGYYQKNLGEIIKEIESAPLTYEDYEGKEQTKSICFDFEAVPVGLCSWRGAYEELAILFDTTGYNGTLKDGDKMDAEQFLKTLKDANGKTFEGWKGGDYKMDEYTPVWVVNHPGNNSSNVVVKITHTDYSVILHTAYCEY